MSPSFKDLFSRQSTDYAKFRPTYPDALYVYLASLTPAHQTAWDCGTGTGQAAVELAKFYQKVIATDPSQKQIDSAVANPKVEYRVGAAEQSGLADHSIDLITVAQAFHWFDHARFFVEAKRVLKPGGVLAIWSYALAKITPEIDAVVLSLYEDILGTYWEKERKLVDEGYANITLPFDQITPPPFEMTAQWSLEHLVGYLSTWSALQTYIKKNGSNPLEAIYPQLQKAWGSDVTGSAATRPVSWALALKVGTHSAR